MKTLRSVAAKRLNTVPKSTVWGEFTPLAMQHKAINLGQGFPTWAPPQFVVDNALYAMTHPDPLIQQYTRSQGQLALATQLQKRYSPQFNRDLTVNDILVTNGSTQALNCACQSILSEGDEVILFEPFYDAFVSDVEMAGGVAKVIPFTPCGTSGNEWKVDFANVERQVTEKTRCILINNPQNVPGKVWTLEELQSIANIAKKYDLLVISDEVYQDLVYDGQRHISIASLDGMWERTITCSSAGKMLSVTGWKIGWVIAPPSILQYLQQTHAHQAFSVATPLQLAVARSLEQADEQNYFQQLVKLYTEKRELLTKTLNDAGLPTIKPEGSFFILADITKVDCKHYYSATEQVAKDWQFCRWLTTTVGVGAIPTTAFCRQESAKQFEKYARFAFCKTDENIIEAGKRLQQLRTYFK